MRLVIAVISICRAVGVAATSCVVALPSSRPIWAPRRSMTERTRPSREMGVWPEDAGLGVFYAVADESKADVRRGSN